MDNALDGLKIGFGVTGSFCTIFKIIPVIRRLRGCGAAVFPILSENTSATDTRFGSSADFTAQITEASGSTPMTSITQVEPIGPKQLFDVLVVAPCTGNSIAKIANGISDTTVTLAVKSHLRNNRPVVIAVSTNDGLSGNAKNIGVLLSRKNIYLVPLGQDDFMDKENSLVSDFDRVEDTVISALNGRQIQPILI
ncbi:MAG TPA: dipicolinate synthase subunit B [Candidatus Monoglobus merdigallinarum]|uniref:Dipicolinate synthase subunit B n=1 Tax=Candidatus Monoglobus merdigallinarum TaxID=2838698 RepID=A0A9D1PPG2_9FIRM|nr:dipicolinate synthase subunit B [Candidatus Monoglobus merdigallinarum]